MAEFTLLPLRIMSCRQFRECSLAQCVLSVQRRGIFQRKSDFTMMVSFISPGYRSLRFRMILLTLMCFSISLFSIFSAAHCLDIILPAHLQLMPSDILRGWFGSIETWLLIREGLIRHLFRYCLDIWYTPLIHICFSIFAWLYNWWMHTVKYYSFHIAR